MKKDSIKKVVVSIRREYCCGRVKGMCMFIYYGL